MRLWVSARIPFTPFRVGTSTRIGPRRRPAPPATSSSSSRGELRWVCVVVACLGAGLLLDNGSWQRLLLFAGIVAFVLLIAVAGRRS